MGSASNMTTRPRLILSGHARWRAAQRGITADDINDALWSGLRESRGRHVLHFDLRTHVGVLVDWRNMVIVTVIYLRRNQYHRLRAQALNGNT